MAITNYLDDFLFIVITLLLCNGMVHEFLFICERVGCPISVEKTEWASQLLIFLGILLKGQLKMLMIPDDKRVAAINLLQWAINEKKVTIKFVQKLTGTLNFLNRAIVPRRVFTHGMYAQLKLRDTRNRLLKPYHHIWLNKEFLLDCRVWLEFLRNDNSGRTGLCRPFIDFSQDSMIVIPLYSDASLNAELGMGALLENDWMYYKWNSQFIKNCEPSIEY